MTLEPTHIEILRGRMYPIVNKVLTERLRQDRKWGEQNHELHVWTDILGEEIGEISKALLEEQFGDGTNEHIAVELVQSAAVIFAMLEFMERHDMVKISDLDLNG